MQKIAPYLLCLLSSMTLTSCMVGPDFHNQTSPKITKYTSDTLPGKTASAPVSGGNRQYFIKGEDIPAQWWALFHSPVINDLVSRGITASPNMVAAQAALQQAQENYNAQFGSTYFPSVTAQFTPQRQRFTGATIGNPDAKGVIFNLFSLSATVSYTFDIFGGERRQLEALSAQVNYQQYELRATYLTLTSNIVISAITDASLNDQIQATQDLINAQQKELHIIQKQFELGGASLADVMTQQTQLAQTRATLPPLEKSLAQTGDSLAALIGSYPGEINIPHINLDTLQLPSDLPLSLPSSLIQQRPDIKASEALLHVASAQVGVATANLFPQLTLNANYGYTAQSLNNLFSPDSTVWTIGGQILAPIFQGGSLNAKKRAAVDAYNQALAQYQETVIQAFQNVADTLEALTTDADNLKAQSLAEKSSHETLLLTQKQYSLGAASYLTLLNAQRQYQQTRINRIQAQALRFNDTAALFQALGGGWWNQENK